jgi:hypothetical protein
MAQLVLMVLCCLPCCYWGDALGESSIIEAITSAIRACDSGQQLVWPVHSVPLLKVDAASHVTSASTVDPDAAAWLVHKALGFCRPDTNHALCNNAD